MKQSVIKYGIGIVAIASAAAFALSNVDLSKVNETLKQISQALVQEEEVLSNFSLTIDKEGTNIDNDEYKLVSSADMNVPWQEAPVSYSEIFDFKVDLAGDEGTEVISGSETFSMDVETVAMFNYYGKAIVDYCESTEKQGRSGILMEEGCQLAKDWSLAKSLKEIFTGVENYTERSEQRLNSLLTQTELYNEALGNEILRQDWVSYQEETQQMLDEMKTLKISYADEEISVTMPQISAMGPMTVTDVHLLVSATQVSGDLKMKINSPYRLYELSKPELVAYLKDLEEENEFAQRHFKSGLQIMWAVFKQCAKL